MRTLTHNPFPAAIEEALSGEIVHDKVVSISEMKKAVKDFLHV